MNAIDTLLHNMSTTTNTNAISSDSLNLEIMSRVYNNMLNEQQKSLMGMYQVPVPRYHKRSIVQLVLGIKIPFYYVSNLQTAGTIAQIPLAQSLQEGVNFNFGNAGTLTYI